MKKIIVPVDFSQQSEYAMHFAVEFSRLFEAGIVLIHVLELPAAQFSTTGETHGQAMEKFYTGEFIKGVHGRLEEWKDYLTKEGVEVKTIMKHGNPFQKISATISDEEADYIIMGSNGASGLKEFFVGSNAARMIRYAKCPVVIVKGETHIRDFKNLIFATDASTAQDVIADQVKEIQSGIGLSMHVVKIKTPYNWLEDGQVKKQLELFAERNKFKNFTLNSESADFIDEGAIKFAEENESGMIMIGTHGRTGLGHLIAGSTAESLVNESEIPVMVFKLPER
ncbi:MAG: universal stress protein [Ekhidna sp.]|nr:universal stress protein [Ekhidna sp.]MBC6410759.1 universal stress protein [Ekhidna sp.]MBC6427259.1 universal stress protein [Ekhidna sp.]